MGLPPVISGTGSFSISAALGERAEAVRNRLVAPNEDNMPLQLTGRQFHNRGLAARDFGDRQLQHIGGLDVSALLEHAAHHE